MPIHLRVAERLVARGWTPYRLAKEAHLSLNVAYRMARPRARFLRLTHATLERLCAALGCQPGDLLHWDGKKPWNKH